MRLRTESLETLAASQALVRQMDKAAIEEYGVPGAVLMENAGAAAAEIALAMLGDSRTALVMAGAGNNAGDGFVVARHLANHGVSLQVITACRGDQYRGDAALNYAIINKMGLAVSPWQTQPSWTGNWGLIVDALLGTGLSGDLRPPYPAMIEFINRACVPVLAIDIPSGLDGDTGAVHTIAVKGARTVTFALPKAGLFMGSGPELAGQVVLADIGIPIQIYPPDKVPWTT